MNQRWLLASLVVPGLLLGLSAFAGEVEGPPANYQLGPGDRIAVNLRDLKELEIKPAVIELDGTIDLQHAGRIRAQGMTSGELAHEVEKRLAAIVRQPKVSVEVVEYGSQPVSVLGAVNKPGVHQLRGQKNLVDVLALAEGMKPEAGNVIKITRPKSSGDLPLPNQKTDPTGLYTTAEVGIKALLEAKTPEANIQIRPHDVISVPRADLIYVLGNVRKPGGFPLAERETITVLQGISMAEGILPASAPQAARILRSTAAGGPATELAIDVKAILANKIPDQRLQPNDVLFIPSSAAKSMGMRALEAGIQMATGIVVWK
jgi:polysaccharide biosynthesis/export protein